ncbi:GNAT family N-acetyltransferase [bacterium]|nr:GNAT family N-acetyltransferase [bacterium]
MELTIERLSHHHKRQVFHCGNDILDDYLKRQASQHVRKHTTAVFVPRRPEGLEVPGFCASCSGSILLADLPANVGRALPRYAVVPTMLLGRLAMDRGLHGKGLDEILLINAMGRRPEIDQVGLALLVVDAKDDSAVAFYRRHRFISLPTMPRRMFLPRTTIVTDLAEN